MLAIAALALAAGCGGGVAPEARDGVLDLRGHDWRQAAPVALDGTWAFTPSRFLSPQPGAATPPDTFLQVPGAWNPLQAAGQPFGATVSAPTA